MSQSRFQKTWAHNTILVCPPKSALSSQLRFVETTRRFASAGERVILEERARGEAEELARRELKEAMMTTCGLGDEEDGFWGKVGSLGDGKRMRNVG